MGYNCFSINPLYAKLSDISRTLSIGDQSNDWWTIQLRRGERISIVVYNETDDYARISVLKGNFQYVINSVVGKATAKNPFIWEYEVMEDDEYAIGLTCNSAPCPPATAEVTIVTDRETSAPVRMPYGPATPPAPEYQEMGDYHLF